MSPCPMDAQLSSALDSALGRLIDVTRESQAAFRENRNADLLRLDKDLEMALGEKERAIGALRQHRREHGCFAI